MGIVSCLLIGNKSFTWLNNHLLPTFPHFRSVFFIQPHPSVVAGGSSAKVRFSLYVKDIPSRSRNIELVQYADVPFLVAASMQLNFRSNMWVKGKNWSEITRLLSPGPGFWWPKNIVKMINKMTFKIIKNGLTWLKISKNYIKLASFFVLTSRIARTAHIYFYQRSAPIRNRFLFIIVAVDNHQLALYIQD